MDFLEHICVLEKFREVNRRDLSLQAVKDKSLDLCPFLDELNLLIDFLEDFVADQLLHVELGNDNLDPSRGKLNRVRTLLLFRDLEDQTPDVKILIANLPRSPG